MRNVYIPIIDLTFNYMYTHMCIYEYITIFSAARITSARLKM